MKQNLPWILLLLLLGAILYWNSLQTPFLWDEGSLIVNDLRVHHGSRVLDIFTKPFFSGMNSGFIRYYRPLITLSFRVDYLFWKLNPFGYHLTNLFFHLANTLLVYALWLHFFKTPSLGFWGAFLFLAHPAHVEAVTYIPGRVDLIPFFFILSSFHLYLMGRDSNKKYWCYFLSVVCYGMALLSKEMALFFPLVILGHAVLMDREKTKWRGAEGILFSGFFVFFVLWSVFRQYVSVQISLKDLLDLPRLPLRLFVIPEILWTYARIWFFPWPLYMERTVPIEILSVKVLVIEWTLFLFILFSILFFFREKIEQFWLLWIGIMLLPVLQIFPVYMNMYHLSLFIAEHFLYFSSVGIIALLMNRLGPFLVTSQKEPPTPPKGAIGLGMLLVCFSFIVVWRNGEYRDRITFFEQTLRYAPWSARVHSHLGLAYIQTGDLKKAKEMLHKAVSLDRSDSIYYAHLGYLYHQRGEIEKAEQYLQKGLELMPDDPLVLYGLGTLEFDKGEWQKAIQLFEKAIEKSPDYICAYSERTRAYWALGEKEKAVASLHQALKRDPGSSALQEIKRWMDQRLKDERG